MEVSQKGRTRAIEAERVLVSIGRRPVVPEGFKGELDRRGCIKVNPSFQTSLPHIYAAGDIIGGMQLAHLAFEEGGWAAANNAWSEPARSEWFVPSCVYTQPEIGSVGLTEAEARKKYGDVVVAKYSLKGNGKAVILGDDGGFCKVIASPDGVVRGCASDRAPPGYRIDFQCCFGPGKRADLSPMGRNHLPPHPTVSEAIKETVLSGLGTGLHSI